LRSAIERNFHLAIESALDIGEIIISAEGFEKPEDYRSVILILERHKVIPTDFAERFIENNLGDFDEFARYLARHLETEEEWEKY
jgi:uncharacterized protein YutE (UPF0331/DUF86 family)